MDLVMSSGRQLPLLAALYRQGSLQSAPPPIRRLWVHDALSEAWSWPGLDSGQMPWAGLTTVDCTNPSPINCGGIGTILVCPGGPSPSCQSFPSTMMSIGSSPWTLPQPGSDPCPTCSISSGPPPAGKPGGNQGNQGNRGDQGNQENQRVTSLGDRTAVPADGTPTPSSAQTGLCRFDLEVPAVWGANNCFTDIVVEIASPGTSVPQKLWIVAPVPLCGGKSLRVDHVPCSPGMGPASVTFTIAGKQLSVRSPLYIDNQ
jgi:hypothetical protein